MSLPNRSGPLFDQIYDILWERILAGEIRPGTRLSDLDWSKRLDVSRTPVREAMRKLQQDGVLLPLDRGGYEVRRMEADDLVALYRCRAVLEALAVRGAARALSDEAVAALAADVEEADAMLAAGRLEEAFALNTRFHTTLLSADDNPYLERLLKDLRRMILFARASLMIAAHERDATRDYRAHIGSVVSDHRAIAAALAARDGAAAAERMESHLFATGEDMARLAREMGSG